MTHKTEMTDNKGRPVEEDEAFREAVRKTAYFLWEQAGRPDGRQDEYYLKALEKHRRERTYDGWLEDGPDGE